MWPRPHTVKPGETLRSIAQQIYGDASLWEMIYLSNQDKVERGLPVEGAVLLGPDPQALMAALLILCADSEDRRLLALIAGECGHLAHEAGRLEHAVELLRERRPRALLLVDGPGEDASKNLRELLRLAPLLPAVVALKRRDAGKAVALMREGLPRWSPTPDPRGIGGRPFQSLRASGTSLSVVRERAPRPRSAPLVSFFRGPVLRRRVLLCGLAKAGGAPPQGPDRRQSWDLPYQHPAALAFDGPTCWSRIGSPRPFTFMTPRLRRRGRASGINGPQSGRVSRGASDCLGDGQGRGLTSTAQGSVARRMRDGKWTVLGRYPAGSSRPVGIGFDGLYLWTVDARERKSSSIWPTTA